jgi:hypothetical protein
MKALVINEPGELQVKDLSAPAIGADEVLVRMRAVGICHSDYELYSGKATDVQRAAPSNCYGNRNRQQPLRRCQEVIASEQAINRPSDAGTGFPSEQGINRECDE